MPSIAGTKRKMDDLLYQLIDQGASLRPDNCALVFKNRKINYQDLSRQTTFSAFGLLSLGLAPNERVAIYLPKLPETVYAMFGASRAGGVFVPVNPLLKPNQVAYILRDCNVRVLITSAQRLQLLSPVLANCHDLHSIVIIEDVIPDLESKLNQKILSWKSLANATDKTLPGRIDADMAAILYTSGSTGNPKGVVLSHKNMVTGAKSVSSYLENDEHDILLAALPFSFDYGLSQLTTAFHVGASAVLMDYLLPRDIVRAITKYDVTGLAAVPPLWNQLVQLEWPDAAQRSLRYITNSGGAMPRATTQKFRHLLPNTKIFLMYGLTEAFRSTYLPPDQVDIRPESMGKAIPNAEILVVREDGSQCAPNEPGELVHRGSLVSMGYWNDPQKTAERFKPCPGRFSELPLTEIAVWSGDQVRRDEEGYLYFISRKDEMIKTSGYRVSPTEVEEVVYALDGIKEVAAIGLPHDTLGQAILLLVVGEDHVAASSVMQHCKKELPNFMVPQEVLVCDNLPRNPNGKIDRKSLSAVYSDRFREQNIE